MGRAASALAEGRRTTSSLRPGRGPRPAPPWSRARAAALDEGPRRRSQDEDPVVGYLPASWGTPRLSRRLSISLHLGVTPPAPYLHWRAPGPPPCKVPDWHLLAHGLSLAAYRSSAFPKRRR